MKLVYLIFLQKVADHVVSYSLEQSLLQWTAHKLANVLSIEAAIFVGAYGLKEEIINNLVK